MPRRGLAVTGQRLHREDAFGRREQIVEHLASVASHCLVPGPCAFMYAISSGATPALARVGEGTAHSWCPGAIEMAW